MMFRRYAEGAAIAPASIFMHLCGLRHEGRGYVRPEFDVRVAASDLALFSYFVHIIRDFEKDQRRRLNYFADDLLAAHGLTPEDLYRAGLGEGIPDRLRDLLGQYRGFAEYYRRRARRQLDHLAERLDPRYQLSLEIIYQLYLQIFERIDVTAGQFRAEELLPNPEEVRARLNATIDTFPIP
jgi:phytoene/squalene synthetase